MDRSQPTRSITATALLPVSIRAEHEAGPGVATKRGESPVRFATGQPRRGRRSWFAEIWRWVITGLLFLIVAAGLLAVSLLIAIYAQARSDQTRPVDAIVVLGTAQFNGRPGRVLEARLNQTVRVYQQGAAPLVIVTGGRAPGDMMTEAEAARDYLIEQGVPAEAIALENDGRTSWESMQGVAALLRERNLSRVLLVSDGFHLLRVKLMARDLGLTPFGAPAAESPIGRRPAGEFSYVVREAAGIAFHLWQTR